MNNSEIVDKVFDRHRIDLKNPKFGIPIVIEMIHDAIKMWDESQASDKDKEIERLKELIKVRERSSHHDFYSHATTLTELQIENQFKERWKRFAKENNL